MFLLMRGIDLISYTDENKIYATPDSVRNVVAKLKTLLK